MDEIQACMISLSDMEKKSSAATSSSTKNDISNRYTKLFILSIIKVACTKKVAYSQKKSFKKLLIKYIINHNVILNQD